jgi:hypothetical protein
MLARNRARAAGLNDKHPTFDARFAVAGVGRNPTAPGCHNVQDIAINRVTDERAENNWSYVFCPRALLMPTQRPELHSTSKPMLRVSYLP